MNGAWTPETLIGKRGGRQWDMGIEDYEWIGERWAAMDTAKAERTRIGKERAQIAAARQKIKYPNRSHHGPNHVADKRERRKVIKANKTFIVWDGEGPRDTAYSLFGNSEGMEICYPTLSTIDCLQLIIDTETEHPDAIHVGFGFNYDVSNILKDLSSRHLSALKKNKRTVWNGWEIEHIPHKWFKIKHGMITATIFEIHSFFMSSLVVALENWKIGPWASTQSNVHSTPIACADYSPIYQGIPPIIIVNSMNERQLVETFKNLRSEFEWKDIGQIRIYMRLELKYTKILMEKLRDTFMDAGYLPDSWHGPGALARMALKRHKVYDAMTKCPPDVQIAARYAFIGGRFSPHLVGHMKGKIHVADRNSAYPYAATFLPNLARGQWRRSKDFESGKFAVYYIRYHSNPDATRIYPLPKRNRNGDVCWPYKVTGWYWAPEAELVANDPDAEFIEALIFDEDDENDRPFACLTEYYRRRRLLKRTGNAAEYTFKLIINSVYGQLAQRVGWDKKTNSAPRSHQLEWAGYITSHCRAAVWKLAVACGEGKCISIDTDGVTALVPIPVPTDEIGDELGQWGIDEYDDGVFWQSGMYGLKRGDTWVKAKTRGIPRGQYEPTDMITALERGQLTIKMTRTKFVGYGLAMNQKHLLNKWTTENYEYLLGGNGKVAHNALLCDKICTNDVHRLINLNMLHWADDKSQPHYLPWLVADEEMKLNKNLFQDLTLFDMNDDDEWTYNG